MLTEEETDAGDPDDVKEDSLLFSIPGTRHGRLTKSFLLELYFGSILHPFWRKVRRVSSKALLPSGEYSMLLHH